MTNVILTLENVTTAHKGFGVLHVETSVWRSIVLTAVCLMEHVKSVKMGFGALTVRICAILQCVPIQDVKRRTVNVTDTKKKDGVISATTHVNLSTVLKRPDVINLVAHIVIFVLMEYGVINAK